MKASGNSMYDRYEILRIPFNCKVEISNSFRLSDQILLVEILPPLTIRQGQFDIRNVPSKPIPVIKIDLILLFCASKWNEHMVQM
jgi:hypothetical protein